MPKKADGGGRGRQVRHGAQSRPSGDAVARHYAAITGERVGTPRPRTPAERAALELARCEAMLDKAQAHHTSLQPVTEVTEYREVEDLLLDVFAWDDADIFTRFEAMRRILHARTLGHGVVSKAKRLAGRYLREAHASRSRALKVYQEAQDTNLPKFANY